MRISVGESALSFLQSGTGGAIPAGGVGFVQHPAETETLTERSQALQVRAIAVHRVDAFRDDEDDAIQRRLFVEHELERIEVIMGEATQAGARGHDSGEHARMHEAVGEDEVALLGQATEHGGVGREAGIHHQPMLVSLPSGEGVLELDD